MCLTCIDMTCWAGYFHVDMIIANPIYDSVFKYLMDDNRVAKLIVSALLAEEVEELEFRPAEVRAEVRS